MSKTDRESKLRMISGTCNTFVYPTNTYPIHPPMKRLYELHDRRSHTHTTLQNEKEKRERQQNDICQSHTLNTCRIKHATFTRFHYYHHTHTPSTNYKTEQET